MKGHLWQPAYLAEKLNSQATPMQTLPSHPRPYPKRRARTNPEYLGISEHPSHNDIS
jgi:hypothetical protein